METLTAVPEDARGEDEGPLAVAESGARGSVK